MKLLTIHGTILLKFNFLLISTLISYVTVKELSEVYEVSNTAIYKWIKQFSKLPQTERIVVEKISEAQKNNELMARIKELERAVGKKQLEIDYYKTTLEVIQEQEGEDLIKKYKPKS